LSYAGLLVSAPIVGRLFDAVEPAVAAGRAAYVPRRCVQIGGGSL